MMQNNLPTTNWLPCIKQLPEDIGVYEVTLEKEYGNTIKYFTDFVVFNAAKNWMTPLKVIAWKEKTQPYIPQYQ